MKIPKGTFGKFAPPFEPTLYGRACKDSNTAHAMRTLFHDEAIRRIEKSKYHLGKAMLQDYLASVVIIEDEYVGDIKPRASRVVLPSRCKWGE